MPAVDSKATHSNWLYTSSLDDEAISLLDRPDIAGVQTLYTWKSLEPEKDKYNFSAIHHDLDIAESKGKRLWVQLQDRTFSTEYQPVPNYLHTPVYDNGSVPQCDGSDCEQDFQPGGWATAQWNPHVRERFQALLKAMAGAPRRPHLRHEPGRDVHRSAEYTQLHLPGLFRGGARQRQIRGRRVPQVVCRAVHQLLALRLG